MRLQRLKKLPPWLHRQAQRNGAVPVFVFSWILLAFENPFGFLGLLLGGLVYYHQRSAWQTPAAEASKDHVGNIVEYLHGPWYVDRVREPGTLYLLGLNREPGGGYSFDGRMLFQDVDVIAGAKVLETAFPKHLIRPRLLSPIVDDPEDLDDEVFGEEDDEYYQRLMHGPHE